MRNQVLKKEQNQRDHFRFKNIYDSEVLMGQLQPTVKKWNMRLLRKAKAI
jgi:hypothetical protein